MGSPRTEEHLACPCCRYPTLEERGGYDICCLCNWEDDGQDDADADEARGGPNGSYSLSDARENFRRYWVMYGPDRDTRIGCGDSEATIAAKKAMARAFESMKGAKEAEVGRLWERVRESRPFWTASSRSASARTRPGLEALVDDVAVPHDRRRACSSATGAGDRPRRPRRPKPRAVPVRVTGRDRRRRVPVRALPICDWGCAIWSCLDCRSDDGVIVTASGGEPFANTGHTLRSWLSAWLEGTDLFEEMFEPGPNRTAINPFTKKPVVLKGQGKPRGPSWP